MPATYTLTVTEPTIPDGFAVEYYVGDRHSTPIKTFAEAAKRLLYYGTSRQLSAYLYRWPDDQHKEFATIRFEPESEEWSEPVFAVDEYEV